MQYLQGEKPVCVPQYSMQMNPVMNKKTITHASMNIVSYIWYRAWCTILFFFPLDICEVYTSNLKKKIHKVLSS